MDTSETNIKKCEKAEEIQKLRPSGADEHDYFWCPVHGFGCDLDKAIWLPRQDQLQEMVNSDGVNKYNPPAMLDRLLEFAREYDVGFTVGSSMEQLWLAFVMREKYNKTWSGEEWKS